MPDDDIAPRIAFVVQRYGAKVIGGAESLARSLAERFVQDLGWNVEVFTTTARDYRTWRNELPAGREVIGGVSVRRFDSRRERAPAFGRIGHLLYVAMRVARLLPGNRWTVPWLEDRWFEAQGPVCPQLLAALEAEIDGFDAAVFITYLYHPTIFGLPIAGRKAVLVPTAHDEPAFHFERVRRLLHQARRIIVNSDAERALVLSKTGREGAARIMLGGVGIDVPLAVPLKEPATPYLLYLGRIGDAKAVDTLLDWFIATPGPTRLVLAGRIDPGFEIPAHPRVEYAGFVDVQRKDALIRNALALVNPSRFESLSLVVLEAMAFEVPVLVNSECQTLADYAKQTSTVFPFRGRDEFARQLAFVADEDWNSPGNAGRLRSSREWVEQHYSWDRILRVWSGCVAELRRGGDEPHTQSRPSTGVQ
jgi:glycosyltransferase involved in cell wall biosynthesis